MGSTAFSAAFHVGDVKKTAFCTRNGQVARSVAFFARSREWHIKIAGSLTIVVASSAPGPFLYDRSRTEFNYIRPLSESGFVNFAGTDAHRLLDRDNEDLAVADFPGLGRGGDSIDGFVDHLRRHNDFDLEFRNEVHGVFRAPIDFRMSFLPAVTFNLGHGHALQAKLGQGFAHLIKLEWLDDCHHQLHLSTHVLGLLAF